MSKKSHRGNLSQFGLIDIPDVDIDEPMDLSDDDIDVEAELAAISGGRKPRPKKPAPAAPSDLDAMIAASLKDIPSDEDVSGDEDDPDLLNELQELAIDDESPQERPRTTRPAPPPPSSSDNSTVNLLQERISNYTIAEKSAKANGESSRARRFGRGLKTLNDLLKQAKAGKPIKEEDIPPAVSLGKPDSQPASEVAPVPPPRLTSIPTPEEQPTPPTPPKRQQPPTPPEPKEPPPPPPAAEDMDPAKAEGLQFILKRKEEFKAAALASKHAGDKVLALEYLKVAKQFDIVIDAYKSGQDMDMSELPTPQMIASAFKNQQKEEGQVQNSAEPTPESAPEPAGLITASSMDEALKQRLAHFQEQESKAKEDGNTSKARRMGRIVKQYQDAIKMNAAGRPIPVDELPTPNGYAPLPNEQAPPRPAALPLPLPRTLLHPSTPSPAAHAATRNDKQLALLLHRQKQFKEAAIAAKKNGDIEQAKEYLRAAKGFDSVIEAARGGLLVDLKSIPLLPSAKKQVDDTFDVISTEECVPEEDVSSSVSDPDVTTRLHQQLSNQLRQCLARREHCRAMGSVAEGNRFDHLALAVKQDLDVVAVAKALGNNPPKFHYENRKFSIVQCNTDLNENELELTIVRGIAYNVPNPKEVDTYVKFEFPYPQDAPVSDRTQCIKDTNSPQYSAVFPLAIQRNARACLRVFKRHAIKFEIYSRGGWFSRDTLLGTASVKLAPLETQVTFHEAVPVMDGRRPAGGSLEVKLRVRTPLVQQQIENTTQRWLVIDN
ncbi:unnamed protein product, partial [Brenthis ino]